MYKHIACALPLLICFGCSTSKSVASTENRKVNSQTTSVTVPDTLQVKLPHYHIERRTTDSVSEITTPIASARAVLNSDGSLIHTLETSDSPLEIPVQQVTETSMVTTASTDTHTALPLPLIFIILLLILIVIRR
ncbi:MAG: hypothetical protein NC343_02045 [Muribaculum sp.]|nr:hypothetical protein [Muribaculaceae bacterium]MCM1080511.1 hypothetical protein [Muribaculum sp.]